jgi:hypothetical protein
VVCLSPRLVLTQKNEGEGGEVRRGKEEKEVGGSRRGRRRELIERGGWSGAIRKTGRGRETGAPSRGQILS